MVKVFNSNDDEDFDVRKTWKVLNKIFRTMSLAYQFMISFIFLFEVNQLIYVKLFTFHTDKLLLLRLSGCDMGYVASQRDPYKDVHSSSYWSFRYYGELFVAPCDPWKSPLTIAHKLFDI